MLTCTPRCNDQVGEKAMEGDCIRFVSGLDMPLCGRTGRWPTPGGVNQRNILAPTEILEHLPGARFAVTGVLFQLLNQVFDERSTLAGRGLHGNIYCVEPNMEHVDMRREIPGDLQCCRERGQVGVGTCGWNKNAFDHRMCLLVSSSFPVEMTDVERRRAVAQPWIRIGIMPEP